MKTGRKIIIAALVSLFLLGLLVRILSLGNPGFEFDTIVTQHEWGKSVIEMGFSNFWQNYDKFLDYFPLAVLFDAFIKHIALLFNSSPETFVLVLKIFNSIVDLLLILHLAEFAKNHLKKSGVRLWLILCILWVLPATWFVSAFFGQFDDLLVLMLVISIINLLTGYKFSWQKWSVFKKITPEIWAGLILGISLSLKPQPLLFLPVLFLYLLQQSSRKQLKPFFNSLLISSILINIYPFLINTQRTVYIFALLLNRIQLVSNGANTFWTLFPNLKVPQDILFSLGNINFPVALIGLIIFIGVLFASFLLIKKHIQNPEKKRNLPRFRYNLPALILLAAIINLAYYLFMMGVHTRYGQFAVVLGIFPLFYLKNKRMVLVYLSSYILFNLAYSFNQLSIYYYFYKKHFSINLDNIASNQVLASLTTFIYLFMLIVLITYGRYLRNHQD